jgi:sugar O-acyltransferase (sialic acid O-acetyltransferase NeuD family)
MDIAFFGSGGFGREVYWMLDAMNQALPEEERYRFIGFFDDGVEKGTAIPRYGKVLGGMDELNSWSSPLALAVTIGNPKSVQGVVGRIKNPNVIFPNIIHPSFQILDPETLRMGKGNIITKDCYVTVDVTIGDFNILNGSVVFGHDVIVGNCNVFMPNVRISGAVTVGDGNLFGISSIVLQQLKIGNDTTIGAGAVLMTKPKEGGVYLGNPATLFKV